ncbi:MAG: UvrD-helicase domain-containing protein [Bacillota bacterium]
MISKNSRILKASAGTGKTYRLSLEYISSILQGRDFSEIAVLTFTRKATAEIRERIFAQIAELLEGRQEAEVWQSLIKIKPGLSFDYTRLNATYRQMLLEKEMINIYTIDSFLNILFREIVAPYHGLYNYEIISSEENQEITEELFRRFISSPERVETIENLLGSQISRDFEIPLNFIQEILHNRWKYLLIEDNRTGQDKFEQRVDFISQWNELMDILQEAADFRGEELNRDWFTAKYKSEMAHIFRLKERGVSEKILKEYIYSQSDLFLKDDTCWNGNKFRKKELKPYKEELLEAYRDFQSGLAQEIFSQEVLPAQTRILDLAADIFQVYDRLKLKQRKFTHQDIANFTYNYLIQEDIDLPGEDLMEYLGQLLGNQIKTLFIDEFQDTSVLQWQILQRLLQGERSLIAVGDAKQSIYGWRDGEKELFLRLPDITGGEVESLDICYRSRQEILNFVNEFFADLQADWEYQAVQALPTKTGGYVEVLVGGSSAEINTATKTFQNYPEDKQRMIEKYNQQITRDLAGAIADKIVQEFSSYGDIAVLARKNSELQEIAEALEARDVPFILHQGGKLLEHQAVEPLYNLILYLAQADIFRLLAFLRSEICALAHETCQVLIKQQEELAEYLAGRAASDFRSFLQTNTKLKNVLDWIKALKDQPYPFLVDSLIRKSGVVNYYKDNSSALKNIYRFFTIMQKNSSLGELLNHFSTKAGSSELEQAAVQAENAVELLTIHKAKGLSFPTEFFYWSPGTRGGGYSSESLKLYLNFSDDYEIVEDHLLLTSSQTRLLQWLDFKFLEKEEERELAEEINNLYVALTRPVDNLFIYIDTPRKLDISGGLSWESNDSYNFYEPALLRATGQNSLVELTIPWQQGEIIYPEPEPDEAAASINLDKYFQPDWPDTAESIQAREAKDFELNLTRAQNRIVGLALHYFMENVKHGQEREMELARKLVLARYGNILGRKMTSKLIERAEKFVNNNPEYFSPKYEILSEYVLETDAGESRRIDRLLVDKEDKEIIILDFKSGAVKSAAQLAEYQKLLAREVGEEFEIQTKYINL